MPDSSERVLRFLQKEEPRYAQAAAELGPEAIPELERLAREADPLLASKATHLASRIGSPQARRVVEAAASRPEPEVRVAAAAAVRNLVSSADVASGAESAGGGLLDRLLNDADAGVRKFAGRSAEAMDVGDQIRGPAEAASEDVVRETRRGPGRKPGRRR